MASLNEVSDIVKVGYVHSQSRHLKKWSKRWFVLRENTTRSPARLIKYLDEKEATKGKPRHEYYINDILNVERLPGRPKGVHIALRTELCKEINFTCDSEAGAKEWLSCLQKEVKKKIDMFPACIINAPHTNFHGEVNLYIADGHLTIIQGDEILSKIPLTTIRKYKQEDRDLMFWIETGRSSPVGEGFIMCQSAHSYNILTKLDDQARGMSNTLSRRGGSDPSANNLYSPGPMQPPTHPRQRFMSEPSLPPYLPERNTLTRGQSTNGRDLPQRRASQDFIHSRGVVRCDSRRPSEPALTEQSRNPYLPMSNPVTSGPQPPLHPPPDEGMPYTDMAREADYLSPVQARQGYTSPYSDRPPEESNDDWDYLSPLHQDHPQYWRKTDLCDQFRVLPK
ncbi:docking protein 5-like isoform X1 [Haliotis cracherodii]|uniref:docking protein 5-like isoform X1 n=1 Tax=Haliotis cracherodii TaxID=6455 RepID=UPI0039ECC3A5